MISQKIDINERNYRTHPYSKIRSIRTINITILGQPNYFEQVAGADQKAFISLRKVFFAKTSTAKLKILH